jgi:hypothetical protein
VDERSEPVTIKAQKSSSLDSILLCPLEINRHASQDSFKRKCLVGFLRDADRHVAGNRQAAFGSSLLDVDTFHGPWRPCSTGCCLFQWQVDEL